MSHRASFPNPTRPVVCEGEENHYRSPLQIGDLVRNTYGRLYRLVAWNNTWSHLNAGRIAHLEPVDTTPYGATTCWERDLTPELVSA